MAPTIPKMRAILKFAESPEINLSRRSMGLNLPKPKESPLDSIIKEHYANQVPAVVSDPLKTISPLEAIKNMPVSRRKVLKTPIQAAVSHVGRGLIGDMAIKPPMPVESLTADAAHEHASDYLSKLLNRSLKRSEEGIHEEDIIEALAGQISLKSLAKKSGVSESELAKHITDDDLKKAFDYAAQEHNNLVEGNNDIWFPDSEEHINKAITTLQSQPTAEDIPYLQEKAYKSAKEEAYENMMNPFTNYTDVHPSIANKTFQKHSGADASEYFNQIADDPDAWEGDIRDAIRKKVIGK